MDKMKVACITGASAGIGEAIAKGLAEDNYCLALIARRKDKLEALADQLKRQYQVQTCYFAIDVSEEKEVERVLASIIKTWGRIDLLFNNAGINRQGTLNISYSDFDDQIRVNVRGAFNMLKGILPHMQEQGSGYVINIASVSAKIGFPDSGAYCASKFALLGLSESGFREYIASGIKVTAICPSWVDTDMTSYVSFSHTEMIRPEDIVQTVRYLLSLSPQACPKELILECVRDYRRNT